MDRGRWLPRSDQESRSERAYSRLLENIGRADDPIRAGLEALFRQHGVSLSALERRRLTFGVEMDLSDETGKKWERTPSQIKEFVKDVYTGRSVQVVTINTFRRIGHVDSDQELYDAITMKVATEYGTGSQAEEERGWIITADREFVLGGILNLRLKDGVWKWSTLKEPIGEWIVNDWRRRTLSQLEEHAVAPKVIREIAKLIPIPPIWDEEHANADKRLFILPNYDPKF